MIGKKLNKNEIEKIIELYNNGEKIHKISEILNISTSAIVRNLKINKIINRKIKRNDINIKEVEKLILEGKKLKEIANEFNCSIDLLRTRLKNDKFSILKNTKILDKNKIIELYNEKKSNKDIAKLLNISLTTISNYLKNTKIKRKFQLNINNEEIKKLILNGTSVKQIAKRFNCTIISIRKRIYRLKINLFDLRRTINENFFSEFNVQSCYWAGVLAADGNVSKNKYSTSLGLIDKEHVIKFRDSLNPNKKIYTRKNLMKKNSYTFVACSRKITKDLKNNFNIIPVKSLILKPPTKIDNINLIRNFIRGYFDGDGAINKNINDQSIGFAGTKDVLEWIKFNLKNNIKDIGNPSLIKQKNIYVLTFHGRFQCPKILKWLYENSNDNIRLNRKYKIALNYIKYYEQFEDELNFKINKIIELYNNNYNLKYIGKLLHIGPQTIKKYLIQNNIKLRIKKSSSEVSL